MPTQRPTIYLASASPRRSALLAQIEVSHEVRPVDVDETPHAGEPPAQYALRVAEDKARALWQRLAPHERRPVLAADTTVAIGAEILGKPADRDDARRILGRLSGRGHEVHTAVALLHAGGADARVSTSTVDFRPLEPREIDWYWETGEPADKAGAYAVQGRAAVFIRHLAGSYSGVMGLPLYETWELLAPVLGLYGTGWPRFMTTEMIVNVSPRETRAALLENGVLQELFVERASRMGLTGNLYKGRVSRVLPGMQAAFIDIGLERTAFLHVSDIVQPADAEGSTEAPRTENIRELVNEGGDILVQVLKDPLGTKGARLTTFITIPSRYLVYMPFGHGVGISARIETEEERNRLREQMQSFLTPGETGGYIVRTAAEGAAGEALRADMLFLRKLWELLSKKAGSTRAGTLVHEDLPLPLRLMRDLVGEGVDRVLVDHERTCERMQEFATTFMPALHARVERYTGSRPIFDLHGAEEEIQRSLERKVPLKSGGYLIIDQTEALTTIDVNTGAYVGHRNLEETIYRTNLEAAVAIARQLRLRNLGGIIIIDFIDMEEEEHRRQVLQALEKALAKDHAKTHVSAVSPLGLVEMTRKRTRESLAHQLCAPCPACEGRGFVKTPETVCYEIFREVLRQAGQFDFQQLMVLAHSDVIERLLDEESAALGELEVLVGKPIRLQTEALYLQDQYDVVLM